MRDYARIVPTFWTRGSGRRLRGNKSAQVLALYLFSAPNGEALGVFYLPMSTMVYETGLTEGEVRAALATLASEGVAHFDEAEDLVYIPHLAKHQIADALESNDRRVKWVQKAVAAMPKHPFVSDFLFRYADAYGLEVPADQKKPLRSPFEAPSKPCEQSFAPLRSQEQEQEQEQEQHQEQEQPQPSAVPGAVAESQLDLVPTEPTADPVDVVWDAYADANRAHTGRSGVKLTEERKRLIRKWLKVYDVETMSAAARGVFRNKWCIEHHKWEPEWAWQNAGNIEKYAEIGREVASAPANDSELAAPSDEMRRQAAAAFGGMWG